MVGDICDGLGCTLDIDGCAVDCIGCGVVGFVGGGVSGLVVGITIVTGDNDSPSLVKLETFPMIILPVIELTGCVGLSTTSGCVGFFSTVLGFCKASKTKLK